MINNITITKITVQIDPKISKGVNLPDFYNSIATALGLDSDSLCYDCTKLDVAKNIQDNIFETLDQKFDPASSGMIWVCSGPKADSKLPDDTVEISRGFFIRNKQPISIKTNIEEVLCA